VVTRRTYLHRTLDSGAPLRQATPMNTTQRTPDGTIIGYAIASEDFDYNPSQEFAGASETVRIPAGRYPVTVSHYYSSGYGVITLEGVSTYRGWFGTNTRVDRTPKPTTEKRRIDFYELAYAVLQGRSLDGMAFEPAEGYEARLIHFTGTDGHKGVTAGLFAADGSEVS
jgi:hypothetical protein